MISVDAVMKTALLTVRDTDTLAAAAAKMEAAGIRHLPVADAHNHVVGIVSNRDLAAAGRRSRTKRVGAVMSRDVKTVRPEDPADRAVALMIESKIGSLPVVDEEETLVGIITETDFLEIAYHALRATRPQGTNHSTGAELP